LPFLPLFDGVLGLSSARMPNSSQFAASANLTFRVMGGKSGKVAARNGKEVATSGKVSGNRTTARQLTREGCGQPAESLYGC
jgi:hypothetical protein